jgi:hypothetical protein
MKVLLLLALVCAISAHKEDHGEHSQHEQGVQHLEILLDQVSLEPFGEVSALTYTRVANGSFDFGSFAATFARGNSTDTDCKEACCQCVAGVTEAIMKKVMTRVEEVCKSPPDCPFIQKACEMMGNHSDTVFGFLLGRTEAGKLGFAYCLGASKCKMQAEETHLFSALSKPREREDAIKDREEDEHAAREPDHDDDKHGQGCRHKCMRKTIHRVMERRIQGASKMCESTQCPRMQRICAWAKAHHDVAVGLLAASVQPWKFASGFCARKHGQHHHGKGVVSRVYGWVRSFFVSDVPIIEMNEQWRSEGKKKHHKKHHGKKEDKAATDDSAGPSESGDEFNATHPSPETLES